VENGEPNSESVTGNPGPRRPRQPIGGALAEALYRTVQGRAAVALPTKLGLRHLRYGEHTFMPGRGAISIVDDELKVECAPSDLMKGLHLMLTGSEMTTTTPALEGVLDNGMKFHAIHVMSRRLQTSEDPPLTLSCMDWDLSGDKCPSFWVADISLPSPPREGNLSLIDQGRGYVSHDHVYLKGAYDYYLLRTERGWVFAVWTGGTEAPSPEALYLDIIAMQVALGQRFRVEHLVGLDSDGRAVAARSVGSGATHPRRGSCYPAVPLGESSRCWMAPFFIRLSAALRAPQDIGLRVPLVFYLNALGDHLDGAYLRHHVAVEAFAKTLRTNVIKPTQSTLVADEERWSSWLSSQEETIRSLATEGHGELLLQKIQQARTAPTGKLVREAYRHYGIELTPRMVRELKDRNYTVHTGRMRNAKKRDLKRDIEKLGVIRMLSLGLIACAVGYRGKINGWERDKGQPKATDTTWWCVDDKMLEEASTWYVATPSDN